MKERDRGGTGRDRERDREREREREKEAEKERDKEQVDVRDIMWYNRPIESTTLGLTSPGSTRQMMLRMCLSGSPPALLSTWYISSVSPFTSY